MEENRVKSDGGITVNPEQRHPIDSFFPPDSMPSVWCPGCGIGTIVYTFIQAIEEIHAEPEKIGVVSGIGCTGKVAEYLNFKSCETTEGNVINYAANLAAKKPNLHVVAFTNNADFLMSSAKDLRNIGRKDTPILMLHINNLIYCLTKNEIIPTTPFMRSSADTTYELPFNIPHLAKSSGAKYVARWTSLRAGWLKYSIIDALSKPGLSVIEVILPCVMYDTIGSKIGDSVDRMKFYNDSSLMKHYEPTEQLDLRSQREIVIGKFVDKNEG
jgi:2-oxoglutarate ferredoxin oxidoreductase subunit beta